MLCGLTAGVFLGFWKARLVEDSPIWGTTFLAVWEGWGSAEAGGAAYGLVKISASPEAKAKAKAKAITEKFKILTLVAAISCFQGSVEEQVGNKKTGRRKTFRRASNLGLTSWALGPSEYRKRSWLVWQPLGRAEGRWVGRFRFGEAEAFFRLAGV